MELYKEICISFVIFSFIGIFFLLYANLPSVQEICDLSEEDDEEEENNEEDEGIHEEDELEVSQKRARNELESELENPEEEILFGPGAKIVVFFIKAIMLAIGSAIINLIIFISFAIFFLITHWNSLDISIELIQKM